MKIIDTIAMISINETLIIQLISFLIFLYLINRILIKPLMCTSEDRENYLANLRDEIANAESEMSGILSELKSRENNAREEAIHLKHDLEKDGNTEADTIFNDMYKQIEALKNKTEEEVKAQIAEARKDLQKEAELLSSQIMEKILGRRLIS